MNDELAEKIRRFNRNAFLAECDGFTVYDGSVWDGWGKPNGPCARVVCSVYDYERLRDCEGNVKQKKAAVADAL